MIGDPAAFDAYLTTHGLLPKAGRPILVACSGGGDSMALVALFQEWLDWRRKDQLLQAETGGIPDLFAAAPALPTFVQAVVVDHALRPESADEAAQVLAYLQQLGVAACCYRANLDDPRLAGRHAQRNLANRQALAREMRYLLLLSHARSVGADQLYLAHTEDDQAETFLINLGRASGVEGLAAMPSHRRAEGIDICRPLLGVTRAALRQYLQQRQWPWVEDPSNGDHRYLRVRVRARLPELSADLGLSSRSLAHAAQNMGEMRQLLDFSTAQFLRRHVAWLHGGAAWLHPLGIEMMQHLPPILGRSVLLRLIAAVSGSSYGPRFRKLARLYARVRTLPIDQITATLAGVAICPASGQQAAFLGLAPKGAALSSLPQGPAASAAVTGLLFYREPAAIGGDQCFGPYAMLQSGLCRWDQRYQLRPAPANGQSPDETAQQDKLWLTAWSGQRSTDLLCYHPAWAPGSPALAAMLAQAFERPRPLADWDGWAALAYNLRRGEPALTQLLADAGHQAPIVALPALGLVAPDAFQKFPILRPWQNSRLLMLRHFDYGNA